MKTLKDVDKKIVLFNHNEEYGKFNYSANVAYEILDIPRGYLRKWKLYGHTIYNSKDEIKDEKIKILKDVRDDKYLNAELKAMEEREMRHLENLEKDGKKAQKIKEDKNLVNKNLDVKNDEDEDNLDQIPEDNQLPEGDNTEKEVNENEDDSKGQDSDASNDDKDLKPEEKVAIPSQNKENGKGNKQKNK